ncbi:HNH endonuclease [Bradyrhizobium sp. USDA 4504]
MTLTARRLRAVLDYDPIAGTFTRDGKVAGSICPQGYLRIKIDGRDYSGHRLAWLYMTGEWPARGVSFWSDDRSDVTWANLRLASSRQTARGRKASNKLGVKGVRLSANGNYRASIFVDGRHVNLGTYSTLEAAGDARADAEREHFGEFASIS